MSSAASSLDSASGRFPPLALRPNLRVGITANVLDAGLAGGSPDGIGVYTRQLMEGARTLPGVSVMPVYRPTLRRPFDRRAGGPNFALPWPVAAAISVLSGSSFPGSGEVGEAVDVLHVTDYHVPKMPRVPVVATLYDAIPLRHPEFASPRLRSLKNRLLRQAAAWADIVLAISRSAVPELVEFLGVRPERVRVIPLGIEPAWLAAPAPAAVERALASHGLRYGFLLAVGTLQPRKNLGRLLSAHRALRTQLRREHPLVIVGQNGWSSDDLVRELLAEQADGTCRWLGYVTREDLRALYAAAAGFVFPSLAEGFGLPLLEAMAAGAPAAASDLPVMRELGGSEVAYFDPESVDAIAAALSGLAAGSEALRGRARAAATRAADYTWQACVERTATVYASLAPRRRLA